MRSEHHPIHGFAVSACLLLVACGGKSDADGATAKGESSVDSAGVHASATASAGKAGSVAVVRNVGSANAKPSTKDVDASVSEHASGSALPGTAGGAGSGGPRSGGANGAAAMSSDGAAVGGSGTTSAGAATSGSGAAGGGGAGTSEDAAASGSGGVAGSGMAGAGGKHAPSTPGATVTLTGQVIEVHTDGSFTPYPGAEVCVLDSMPPVCATGDSSANVMIKMPANSRTGLTMTLPKLFPMFTPITTGTADINLSGRGEWSNYGASVVLTEETRSAATSMLKTTLDPNKGQADMIVFGLGNGTVTLEGAPAELKWFASGGQFTVTDGPAPFGSTLHGFTNIEPGMRTFRAELNGQPCKWDPMIWAGDEPGTVTVPIRAGLWTRLMEVRCN